MQPADISPSTGEQAMCPAEALCPSTAQVRAACPTFGPGLHTPRTRPSPRVDNQLADWGHLWDWSITVLENRLSCWLLWNTYHFQPHKVECSPNNAHYNACPHQLWPRVSPGKHNSVVATSHLATFAPICDCGGMCRALGNDGHGAQGIWILEWPQQQQTNPRNVYEMYLGAKALNHMSPVHFFRESCMRCDSDAL
jgi:hypothetical protein